MAPCGSTIFVVARSICLYFVFHSIAPVNLKKYDLIVIPLYNAPHSPHKNPNQIPMWPKQKKFRSNNDLFKLDIGHYDEATEMVDIDNFDFNNDRAEVNTNSDSYENQKLGLDDALERYGQDKIVGGFEVDINLYPYHVAYGTNCGGAIIDKKWVITAGHCGKKTYIRVGSKYLNQGAKISIKNNYIHPKWAAKGKDHPFDFDFQLLELNENLKFDDNVQPIKLAHIEDMVIGKVITVTGWGNTEENGPYSSVLRAVRVPIISKENCQKVPFPYFRGALTARMFCAGFSEGKKDACQGDSGGPAVAYDRLLGMVSFGYGCATPGSYGVYSKVAKVRSWIEEVTGLMILGGYDIEIQEAPYQVNYGDICGGVIIHKKWVLTVAHCGSESYFIRAGSKYRVESPKVKIKNHFIHPLYRRNHSFDYDVQLLELYRKLRFGETVNSVELSDGEIGEFIYVTGWGYSREKGDFRDTLQRVEMNLVAKEKCQRVQNEWYNHTLTSRMFCAGDSKADACQGDSGGAAISYNRLVGISSFGFGCGRDVPGVYINVSCPNIRLWIRQYTGVQ